MLFRPHHLPILEIKGEVHPRVLANELEYRRLIVDQVAATVSTTGAVFYLANALNIDRNSPAAIDPMWPSLQDLSPPPFGNIYDVDVPGVSYADFSAQPAGTRVFARYNFAQYARINGMRCSNDFFWHANLAAKKGSMTNPNGIFVATRPDYPDDNSVGSGHTSPIIWKKQ